MLNVSRIFVFYIALIGFSVFAEEVQLQEVSALPSEESMQVASEHLPEKQWSMMLYGGLTIDKDLWEIFTFQYRLSDEKLMAFEVMYGLSKDNVVRRFLYPVIHNVQFANIVAIRQSERDVMPILEWNPYFLVRWDRFPWKKWVLTSFAVGEGISLTTAVPMVERAMPRRTSRFLNYLMFEMTLGAPVIPDLELVARIHHRSGVYGLYGVDSDVGSNVVGFGLRWKFA